MQIKENLIRNLYTLIMITFISLGIYITWYVSSFPGHFTTFSIHNYWIPAMISSLIWAIVYATTYFRKYLAAVILILMYSPFFLPAIYGSLQYISDWNWSAGVLATLSQTNVVLTILVVITNLALYLSSINKSDRV